MTAAVPKLAIVTGTSCVGKTTVSTFANNRMSNAIGLDVDEQGTPDTQHIEWLQWRSAQLLHEATEYAKSVDTSKRPVPDFVITGVTWPFELISSTAWGPAQDAFDITFVHLVISDELLKERLYERLASRPKADRKASYKNNLRLRDVLSRQVDVLYDGEEMDVTKTDWWTPARVAHYII